MKNKKRIVFLAPETKGWPYFVYKDLVNWLKEKYWDELDVIFVNSKKNYFKLQFWLFWKIDVLFSVIPFIFRPIWIKKYIYNPRWNFEIEKKKKNLWNKLLYFARNNLDFADNIWLVSYFLADKLYFRKKYEYKIKIIPNFINIDEYDFWEKKYDKEKFKILTITSFKFYDKWKWIINLAKVISKLWKRTDKKIEWTIIWNDKSDNYKKIKKEFDKVSFKSNIIINWEWWCDKANIKEELKKNDYFLYWTFLDNFPNIILEAIASNMKVLVNDFESFKYFLNKKIICENEEEMVEKILEDKVDLTTISKFDKNSILDKIYTEIK